MNPISVGGYIWVVFVSPRDYGNKMLSASNPTYENRKQLWVAAIDANPQPGKDPSHPAFWLPGQDLTTVNMPCAPSSYTVIEMRGGAPSSLLLAQVGNAAAVAAHFDRRTSLAAVAVTLEPLLDLLGKRLRAAPSSQGWPSGGGRGPSGAGASAWEVRPFPQAPRGEGEETVEPLDAPRRRGCPS